EYYIRASKEAKSGSFDEAIKYFQKAVAINPYLADAYYQLGALYAEKGWSERAEEAFRTAASLNPKFTPPAAYENLKRAQTEESGEDKILSEAGLWAKEIVAQKETAADRRIDKEFRGLVPYKSRLESEPLAVEAKYIETSKGDLYPAQTKGSSIVTRLDPYHPEHEDFKIPYYKDREGLKLTPIVGVRGEYMQERQMVGIESLMQEAQEFNQRTDEEMRKYISTNRKQYHKEEVILHYNETWPKFTYSHLEERANREYDAKYLWSTNNVFYDDYDRDYYQIDYTIPGIRKLGSLRLKFRYGDEEKYKPNDLGSASNINSYLFGLETTPYLSLLGTFGAKFEFMYIDGDLAKREEAGGGWNSSLERNYFAELNFYYPEKFLSIKPHFYYKKERFYPSYNTWWLRKNGVKVEKDFNGRVRFVTDWTYINYAREKDPYLASANHIGTSAWKTENEFQYEFVRDWKAILGLDYGTGLGFDDFKLTAVLNPV
ncbi:MAG: tetratricopeptide repeat protein, partial [Candidatus Omnitrophica bacterium]|nr:tetratricopeptide repeat protein [Candidatus Omnitrophota bacterium]